jgi:hypothetical protein
MQHDQAGPGNDTISYIFAIAITLKRLETHDIHGKKHWECIWESNGLIANAEKQ